MPFIPVDIDNPVKTRPYAVYSLIALNAAVFFYTLYVETNSGREGLMLFFKAYGSVPAHLSLSGMITSMFLHGGFMHIIGNMFFLWMFGDNVEDFLGAPLFLLLYLVCGVCADFAHARVFPGSEVPAIGASGAISGVLGAYMMLFPRATIELRLFVMFSEVRRARFRMAAFAAGIFWLGEQALFGWLSTGAEEASGVAFWAHIGGFVTGLLAGLLFTFLGFHERYAKKKPAGEKRERPVWSSRGGTFVARGGKRRRKPPAGQGLPGIYREEDSLKLIRKKRIPPSERK